ncbi:uncharacterized protein isoform X2 [Rhodnius prolixus]|uniref:uncharacterized protein isoform X2 n=1 Tax=Rhodnius prolixus TaxID=13249 RepID=UPI003D188360
MTAKKSGRVEESDSKTAEDEQFKSSKYSRKNRSNKCSKRPPIYIPRSEHNLLTNKGIQLIELIGQGSYSKVYLCKKFDRSLEPAKAPVIAMKIVDTSKTSPEYINKFLPRELSIILKIRHPHIIRLYLLFQRKSKFYICMRYAERGDLLEYVLASGLITENRARFWASQLAKAIEYLHTMNIAHRDIKTENILITEHFNVKLCDFGFSRYFGNEEMSSTFCGSVSYSPPEVLQTKPYDVRKSDMWSLGVVIFVMLVKRLPFIETDNPKALLIEQLKKSYVVPPKMDQVLSLNCKKVIKHLLEPIPLKRWCIEELISSQWLAMDFRDHTTQLYASVDRPKYNFSTHFRDTTFENALLQLNVEEISYQKHPVAGLRSSRGKLSENERFFLEREQADQRNWIRREQKEWKRKQSRRSKEVDNLFGKSNAQSLSLLTAEQYEELNQTAAGSSKVDERLARKSWFDWRKDSSNQEEGDSDQQIEMRKSYERAQKQQYLETDRNERGKKVTKDDRQTSIQQNNQLESADVDQLRHQVQMRKQDERAQKQLRQETERMESRNKEAASRQLSRHTTGSIPQKKTLRQKMGTWWRKFTGKETSETSDSESESEQKQKKRSRRQ